MAGECRLLRTHTSFFFFSTLLWSSGQAYVAQTLPAVCCGSPDWKIFLGNSPPFSNSGLNPFYRYPGNKRGGEGGRERGGRGRLLLRPRRWRHHTILQTGLFPPPPLGGRQQHLSLSLSTFEAETVRSPPFPPPVPPCSLRGIVSCCHNHQRTAEKGGKGCCCFFGGGWKEALSSELSLGSWMEAEEEGQLLQLAAFELPSWKREKKEGGLLSYIFLSRGPRDQREYGEEEEALFWLGVVRWWCWRPLCAFRKGQGRRDSTSCLQAIESVHVRFMLLKSEAIQCFAGLQEVGEFRSKRTFFWAPDWKGGGGRWRKRMGGGRLFPLAKAPLSLLPPSPASSAPISETSPSLSPSSF